MDKQDADVALATQPVHAAAEQASSKTIILGK
jgi:hypothetical protein